MFAGLGSIADPGLRRGSERVLPWILAFAGMMSEG